MLKLLIHSDYQTPEITRKLTLESACAQMDSLPVIGSLPKRGDVAAGRNVEDYRPSCTTTGPVLNMAHSHGRRQHRIGNRHCTGT